MSRGLGLFRGLVINQREAEFILTLSWGPVDRRHHRLRSGTVPPCLLAGVSLPMALSVHRDKPLIKPGPLSPISSLQLLLPTMHLNCPFGAQ